MLSTHTSNRDGAILAGVTDIAASIQYDGACPFICGIPLQWQFKDEACGVLARHSSRNYEEVHTSSRGVWEIAVPGDALQTPAWIPGHVALLGRPRHAADRRTHRRRAGTLELIIEIVILLTAVAMSGTHA
jgi:hypothetical protein